MQRPRGRCDCGKAGQDAANAGAVRARQVSKEAGVSKYSDTTIDAMIHAADWMAAVGHPDIARFVHAWLDDGYVCKSCAGSIDAPDPGIGAITFEGGAHGSDAAGHWHECPACGKRYYTRRYSLD